MRKLIKAQKMTGIYSMTRTTDHIMQHINEAVGLDALDQLTSKQIADMINLAQHCYQAGKADAGAEVIDGGAVWIAPLKRLIELDSIRAIQG